MVTEPSLLMRSGALCDDVWRSARLSGAGFSPCMTNMVLPLHGFLRADRLSWRFDRVGDKNKSLLFRKKLDMLFVVWYKHRQELFVL